MARFYPRTPADGTPQSEITVWKALASLPNSWLVFHSIAWQVPKRNRVFDGEADFVLLNPKHGMIVLEVKGGLLEIRDGTWYQRNTHGGEWRALRQSPFDQAKSAMYDLRNYLQDRIPRLTDLPASRAVVLPASSHPGGSLGPDIPSQMIIGRDTLSDMPGALDRLVAYAKLRSNLPTELVADITKLLAPTVQLRSHVGTELALTEQKLIDLTNQQVNVLNLLRNHRRALVTGGAGTGKTILAVERARRLALDGAEVLLTCYNRPLGDHLASELADEPQITAKSFHALGRDLVTAAGLVAPVDPPDDWYKRDLPEMLPLAVERTGKTFDAIVVDEGQDFSPLWFTALQMMLTDPDEGPMYVFADPNQAIYVDAWEPPFAGEPFPLDTNCRNTRQIGAKVAAVIGVPNSDLGVDGMEPSFVAASGFEEVKSVLDRAVARFIGQERVEARQITILSQNRRLVESFRGGSIGGQAVGDLTSGGLTVETIHRFKGLENDVVFVVLDEIANANDRALAYIGMSRAKGLLVVVGPKGIEKDLNW